MFPNLEAEQARNNHSNAFVAEQLGISRQSYENKKRTGTFKLKEITQLLTLYGNGFEYLFYSRDKQKTA